jgi:hypothetical protein
MSHRAVIMKVCTILALRIVLHSVESGPFSKWHLSADICDGDGVYSL